jgi:hypothetical protein
MRKYHCTVNLLFDLFGLVCFANKNKHCNWHTADSKPVKQEVNCTVILPPSVFPEAIIFSHVRPFYERAVNDQDP